MKPAQSPFRFCLKLPVLVGGGAATSCALLTRLAVGGPLSVVHKLDAYLLLPPLWLMSLLWLASFALLGGAAGYLWSHPTGGLEGEARLWRGGTFMVLAVVFSLVWYTLLFGKLYLLISWFCLLPAVAAALACAYAWWWIGKGAAALCVAFGLWQICLFFLQLAALLHA